MSTCIVAGPEIVRAPLVVKVPVTLGNPAKSNVAVMVTGTGVGVADAEGAEPIAKQPSTTRIVVNVMFRFFILLISFCSFGLLWLLVVRSHFWPFTDVLREIWPGVTRKMKREICRQPRRLPTTPNRQAMRLPYNCCCFSAPARGRLGQW